MEGVCIREIIIFADFFSLNNWWSMKLNCTLLRQTLSLQFRSFLFILESGNVGTFELCPTEAPLHFVNGPTVATANNSLFLFITLYFISNAK